MKRKTAKEILAESFRELAANRPIDKITIKDITANCGYSTATFYRQFKDKYDLIAWDYTRELDGIMGGFVGTAETWRVTLLQSAAYFLAQREYLRNLLTHTEGMDAFVEYMRAINYDRLCACILQSSGRVNLDEKTKMYVRLYVAGTVQLTCEWILGKYSASMQDIADVYEHALPAPIERYIYGGN